MQATNPKPPHIAVRPHATPPQPIEAASHPNALLKIQTVSAVTGLSAATIYRKLAEDKFPCPVRLGSRCTRWKAGDLAAWLAAQTPDA